MPDAPSLHVFDLARRHGTRTVFHGLAVQRDEAGIVGVRGANGSGKTSLLRILAQLSTPSAGTVEICGLAVRRADARAVRRLVGFAPHEPVAYGTLSVAANFDYALRLASVSRAERESAVRAACTVWQLDDVIDAPVATLSRGWRQRYALARADLLAPRVLLLDEPTVALDDAGRELLDRRLQAWRKERIVLVASHELTWLDEHCDQLLDVDAFAPGAARPDPFAQEVYA